MAGAAQLPAVKAPQHKKTNRPNMLTGFEKIVEERIQKAQYKGEFDNLSGAGRPLDFSDDRHIPEDLRLAFKILKNADFLPPEIELKKKIHRTEALLANMKESSERYRALKKLNFLIMKFNATRNSDARFEMPQHYATALTERLAPVSEDSKR
jgi:hypothetical protein